MLHGLSQIFTKPETVEANIAISQHTISSTEKWKNIFAKAEVISMSEDAEEKIKNYIKQDFTLHKLKEIYNKSEKT